jgi:hypothetical protein
MFRHETIKKKTDYTKLYLQRIERMNAEYTAAVALTKAINAPIPEPPVPPKMPERVRKIKKQKQKEAEKPSVVVEKRDIVISFD